MEIQRRSSKIKEDPGRCGNIHPGKSLSIGLSENQLKSTQDPWTSVPNQWKARNTCTKLINIFTASTNIDTAWMEMHTKSGKSLDHQGTSMKSKRTLYRLLAILVSRWQIGTNRQTLMQHRCKIDTKSRKVNFEEVQSILIKINRGQRRSMNTNGDPEEIQ